MKLIMIATSHAGTCALGHPTGLWLEELAVPYYAFVNAGIEVEIASVNGGSVPLDPLGLELTAETPDEVGRFIVDPRARDMVGSSRRIDDLGDSEHGAAFLPGGYGAMFDLPENAALGKLLSQFLADGRPVGAVGHGAAGLLSATNGYGAPAVAGRSITCFSDAEEASLGLCEYVPFLLETRLRELGAKIETAAEFQPLMRQDGSLVTGQNPASTTQVTEAMLALMR